MKEVEPSPHQNHLWPGDLDPIRGWKEEAAGRQQAPTMVLMVMVMGCMLDYLFPPLQSGSQGQHGEVGGEGSPMRVAGHKRAVSTEIPPCPLLSSWSRIWEQKHSQRRAKTQATGRQGRHREV